MPQQIEKIPWYYARWQAMQHPVEELYRLRQLLTEQFLDRFHAASPPDAPTGFSYRDQTSNVFCRETLAQMQPQEWSIERFPLLGISLPDVGKIRDWRKDYKNGPTSPLKFSHSLNPQDFELVGDVKYVAVIARFHFLPFYAIDAVAHDSPSSMLTIEQTLSAWMAQNPYLCGIHWKTGIEVGIRALNLIMTRKILSLGDPPPGVLHSIDRLVYWCLHFLLRHPSLYSSANNHRVAELLGLIVILAHYEHPNRASLLDKAADSFIRELFRQNHSDGGNKEQSIQYHIEVLDAFLIGCCLLRETGYKLPQNAVDTQLRLMGNFLNFFLYPDGCVIRIGDDDEGQYLFPYHDPGYTQSWSVLASLDLFLGAPTISEHYNFDLRQYLIGGEEWRRNFQDASKAPHYSRNLPSTLFAESGYAFFHNEDSRLLMDVGEIGLRPMAAHGHSDILSFTLDYKGVPFIVDPGTFQYHGRSSFRHYFRSARAHNTVSVNGLDQALSGGRMIWLKQPTVGPCQFQDNDDMVFCEAEHDGFIRQGVAVRHRRRVEYRRASRSYLVTDWLQSKQSYRIELVLHFHPDVVVERLDSRRFVASHHGLDLQLENDLFGEAQLLKGVEHPPMGWYSDKYDEKRPSYSLLLQSECRESCEIHTTIRLMQ